MTKRNLRGAYVTFEHDRAQDWDWLSKWQPNVIRYLVPGKPDDPNSVSVDRIRRIHETCPGATILLRCWDVDDNDFKAHDAMVADPIGTAERQVDWWAKVFNRCEDAGVPRTQLMAGLNNETGPEKDASLYPYSQHALEVGTQRRVRLGVFVFSVGRPSLAGEAEYTIPTFERLAPLILQNNGAIVLHQYMQPEGMYAVWVDDEGNERKDWTYLMGRDLRWTVNVPIIIGEWGIDGILYNRHPDPKYGNSGWRNFKSEWPPSRYADEYVECVRQANDNVIGICPFIEDWSDHKWQSFDLIDAYSEFLARKEACVKESTPPFDLFIPIAGTGSKTQYINAPSGANLRTQPQLGDNLIDALPYGETVTLLGHNDNKTWSRVDYQGATGWINSSLLSFAQPTPPQTGDGPQVPTGDNYVRAREFVRRWEGDYQNNPADIGNWTGCEVGKGENRGTKYGISACSYPNLDIPNISMAQADAIYEQDYWRASGADKLPWPYCLFVFDTAVLHGVGTARKWQEEAGNNPYAFAAKRLHTYTKLANWKDFGAGWVNRTADLLEEASK